MRYSLSVIDKAGRSWEHRLTLTSFLSSSNWVSYSQPDARPMVELAVPSPTAQAHHPGRRSQEGERGGKNPA